jgi:hypothetical protein
MKHVGISFVYGTYAAISLQIDKYGDQRSISDWPAWRIISALHRCCMPLNFRPENGREEWFGRKVLVTLRYAASFGSFMQSQVYNPQAARPEAGSRT